MGRIVLVTDTSADLPADVMAGGDVLAPAGQYAFDDHTFTDGDQTAAELYGRIVRERRAPRAFGVPEAGYRAAFDAILAAGDEPLAIVAPFDVNPSFTTAVAAQLAIDDANFKVLNAGVASAGLCSLIVSLLRGVRAGWTRDQLLDAIDRIGPQCDTLFVPADTRWLEVAGRLPLIEDRLGEVGDGFPVVRAGTRITGVALCDSLESAIREAAKRAGARSKAGTELVVTIDHADRAAAVPIAEAAVREQWPVAQVLVTQLSATFGAQLGPGAVGIGVAPALKV